MRPRRVNVDRMRRYRQQSLGSPWHVGDLVKFTSSTGDVMVPVSQVKPDGTAVFGPFPAIAFTIPG